jgi:hypothetical protein
LSPRARAIATSREIAWFVERPTIMAAATPAVSEYSATSPISARLSGLTSMKWLSTSRSTTVTNEATTAMAIIVAASPARRTRPRAAMAVTTVAAVIGPTNSRTRSHSLMGRTGIPRRAR